MMNGDTELFNQVISAANAGDLVEFAATHPVARDAGMIAMLRVAAGLAEHDGEAAAADGYRAIAQFLAGSALDDAAARIEQMVRGFERMSRAEFDDEAIRAAGLAAADVAADAFWSTLHADAAVSALDYASRSLGMIGRYARNEAFMHESARAALCAYELSLDSPEPAWPARLANSLVLRLCELYRVSGDAQHLVGAVDAGHKAVELAHDDHDLANHRANLASALSDRFGATGDRALAEEAIEVSAAALGGLDGDDPRRPSMLSNHAMRLFELRQLTGDDVTAGVTVERVCDLLERAIEMSGGRDRDAARNLAVVLRHRSIDLSTTGRAIELITATLDDPDDELDAELRTRRDLAALRVRMHALTGDTGHLDDAIATCRAIAAHGGLATPTGAGVVLTWTQALTALSFDTGDDEPLEEAERVLAAFDSAWDHIGARGRVALGRSGGVLARGRGDHAEAAHRFGRAYDELRIEMRRLGDDGTRRRDLSTTAPGLLPDLVTARVRAGDVRGAIDAVEADRLWLPAPSGERGERHAARHVDRDDLTTSWIVTTRTGTVIVHDDLSTTVLDEVTTDRVMRAALATLDFARGTPDREAGVPDLLAVTSLVTDRLRPAPHHLVVPVGVCSLLPFGAGRARDGRPLIEWSTVTVGPSAAWARAAGRERPPTVPAGGFEAFGAFHDGGDDHPPRLDLDHDRATFSAAFPTAPVLDRPSAEAVVDALDRTVGVAHVSCHGRADPTDPLSSSLVLGGALTLRSMLDRTHAPWLVNLSACETGVPDLTIADEMISFPAGFVLAGAAHVIATRWAVSDAHASQFNARFYDELGHGIHPAVAHRRAVLGLADEHPFYWACFVHVGAPPPA